MHQSLWQKKDKSQISALQCRACDEANM